MKYHYSVCTSYIGEDTEVMVEFDYHPEEPLVRHPIERAHPGSPAYIELITVKIADDDIMESLNDDTLDRLEQAALDHLKAESYCCSA